MTKKTTTFLLLPLAALLVYLGSLIFSEVYFDSYTIVANYFCIHPIPYFVDLKILLCGIDAMRDGIDPYMKICYNNSPFFNYPYVWKVFSFFPFLKESNLFYIGFSIAGLFFLSLFLFIGKISFKESIIYSAVFVSPAVMLGVERGNCDLVIFFILMFSLLAGSRPFLLPITILFTSMLKLFPIGAMLSLMNQKSEKKNMLVMLIFAIITSFFVYLIMAKDNIQMVSDRTPRPFTVASFGLGNIPSLLFSYRELFKEWFSGTFMVSLMIYTFGSFKSTMIFFSGFVVISFTTFYSFLGSRIKALSINADRDGSAFLIGSGIFITSFIIGYNWEYRLIFLIFTMPQLFLWTVRKDIIPTLLMALTVVVLWQSFFTAIHKSYHFFGQLLSLILFYFHLTITVLFLYKKRTLITSFRLKRRLSLGKESLSS